MEKDNTCSCSSSAVFLEQFCVENPIFNGTENSFLKTFKILKYVPMHFSRKLELQGKEGTILDQISNLPLLGSLNLTERASSML